MIQSAQRGIEAAIVILDRAGAVNVNRCSDPGRDLCEIHFLAMEALSAVMKRMHAVIFNGQLFASKIHLRRGVSDGQVARRRRKSNPPNEMKMSSAPKVQTIAAPEGRSH